MMRIVGGERLQYSEYIRQIREGTGIGLQIALLASDHVATLTGLCILESGEKQRDVLLDGVGMRNGRVIGDQAVGGQKRQRDQTNQNRACHCKSGRKSSSEGPVGKHRS